MLLEILINIIWYTLKYIIILYNHLIKILSIFKFNKNKLVNNSFFIKNNKLIQGINIKNIDRITLFEYDYIIYKSNLKKNLLMTILYNIEDLKKNINLIPCCYQFIYINIKIHDKTIDITKLLNNFYSINNIIFNTIFMKWLVEYKLELNLTNYNIVILDNNFKEIIIDNRQYIKLNSNNYDIITR